MKIPLPHLLLLLSAVAFTGAGAAPEDEPPAFSDPFAGMKPAETGPRDASNDPEGPPNRPDHLQPVAIAPQEWRISYDALLREKLRLDEPFLARVMVRPSFDGESVLRILEGQSGDGPGTRYTVTCLTAEKSLWYSLPEHNEDRKQVPVGVKGSQAPLPASVGIRTLSVWEEMIRRTRKPAEPDTGFDGTTYEFATPGGQGEASSPRGRRSTGLFAALARALLSYTAAGESERPGLLNGVEAALADLEAYLKTHPADTTAR